MSEIKGHRMKTVDLRSDSSLMKKAQKFLSTCEYSKSDWELDQGGDKFHRVIEDLPEDVRLACVFIMNGDEDVIQEHAESAFKNDLVLSFGE